MSTVKTKFTLHEHYKDFNLGVSKLEAHTLIPYSLQGSLGCMLLVSLAVAIFLIFMVGVSVHVLVRPFLLHYFGADTTAQIIECREEQSDRSRSLRLTYRYTWNHQTRTSVGSVFYYGSHDCSDYLDQTYPLRIVIPDPSINWLPVANESEPIFERIGDAMCFPMFGIAAFFALHKLLHDIHQQLWSKVLYRRLVARSLLLEGEILRIHAYKPSKTDHYVVSITYGFETPHQKHLTGWAEARRDDLKDTPLPPIGSPVSVLYADDHAHMML